MTCILWSLLPPLRRERNWRPYPLQDLPNSMIDLACLEDLDTCPGCPEILSGERETYPNFS
jgi:hypothetical protein